MGEGGREGGGGRTLTGLFSPRRDAGGSSLDYPALLEQLVIESIYRNAAVFFSFFYGRAFCLQM